MTWRLHLTNEVITRLDILPGIQTNASAPSPALLVVWLRRNRCAYFQLDNGAPLGEAVFDPPFSPDYATAEWRDYVATLRAPNNHFLPAVHAAETRVHLSADGVTQMFHDGSLHLFQGGEPTPLSVSARTEFRVADLEQHGNGIAALDTKGKLHTFRAGQPVQIDETGIGGRGSSDLIELRMAHADCVFLSDSRHLLRIWPGVEKKTTETHYRVGRVVSSPSGKRLLVSDNDSGVIRLYDGTTMEQTHQRFAIDLIEESDRIQLIADAPPAWIAVSALALEDGEHLAFAMSGFVCVTTIDQLDPIP